MATALTLCRHWKRFEPSSIRFSHHKRSFFSKPRGKTYHESRSHITSCSSTKNAKDVWKMQMAYPIRLTF
jgi:hypothetical protein